MAALLVEKDQDLGCVSDLGGLLHSCARMGLHHMALVHSAAAALSCRTDLMG